MGGSYTGPSLPHPQSRDSNGDREMDIDDHRDFMDQDVPAGQFPTADPGPIHQFLSQFFPDWLNFNLEDLDRALESITIPLKGPSPPGISLQDAIEVKQWHNIHCNTHKTPPNHTSPYISVYDTSIAYRYRTIYRFDIVCNIGYDIVYDV